MREGESMWMREGVNVDEGGESMWMREGESMWMREGEYVDERGLVNVDDGR